MPQPLSMDTGTVGCQASKIKIRILPKLHPRQKDFLKIVKATAIPLTSSSYKIQLHKDPNESFTIAR
jgi:hypothetical protein